MAEIDQLAAITIAFGVLERSDLHSVRLIDGSEGGEEGVTVIISDRFNRIIKKLEASG